MSGGMDGKKLLIAVGGAVGVGAVLYYLLKEDAEKTKSIGSEEKSRSLKTRAIPVEEITKEQVLQVLQEIIQSQELMKGYMKELTKELLSKQLSFPEIYKRVEEVQPKDPLEKYGLSMMDFDQLLDKHQSDPAVRQSIATIMGTPTENTVTSEKVQGITVQKILDVHRFMLTELEKLAAKFQEMPDKSKYEVKTVTIAAQAIVGAKVEEEYGITSEDIESAVLLYHMWLSTNKEFADINVQIQHTMGMLMGGRPLQN